MNKNYKNVKIHPTAIVEDDVEIGEGTSIWHHAHVRKNAHLGKKCILGKGVYVDAEVTIGDGVKIQNRVSIYHGVTIGNNVFLGPHVVFTNDLYPRAFNQEWKIVKTKVEDGVSIGANSVIICGITLGKFAMIGSGSVITKDVPEHALVFGNPARIRGYVCKCGLKVFPKPPEGEKVDVSKFVCENCERILKGWVK
ncbi:N-acetyltransferase [Candidatus Heimdallarchaeota archaeon]|nr:MAG: N-acetyltransferase [Candidatus Gerdarchaeota archaeon]RLI71647.1 MAG: N-acetyltransferase [Candidatus Heimdallarchaeota archaeon]